MDAAIQRMYQMIDRMSQISPFAYSQWDLAIGKLEMQIGTQKRCGKLGEEKHNRQTAVPIAGIANMGSCPGTFDHTEETGRSIPILLRDTVACPKTTLGDCVKGIDELISQPNGEIRKVIDCSLPAKDSS